MAMIGRLRALSKAGTKAKRQQKREMGGGGRGGEQPCSHSGE